MSQPDSTARARFGTIGGVFTPCTLTILGVIMFLRLGYVVGEGGVFLALAIILASKVITLLTTLSLSAIATNTRVGGGGAYYFISRSLGVEHGGAIGVVFFFAQAVSVAMYVIGFSEAFVGVLAPGLSVALVGTVVNVAVFVCVCIGAGWAIKVQYGILAILGAALLSFYLGAFNDFDTGLLRGNLDTHFTPGENAFTLFALFFPAVTGIMAGANMSGDLRDPGRSIPAGTLAAVAVTAVVYLSLVFLLAGARPAERLIENNLVIGEIAVWPVLVTAGIFAATLSSALGSMMGAPRILQAFARDAIFPWLAPFARGSGTAGEPRRAAVLTFAIAQAFVLVGDLNAIAPVITMAFMITYGTLNLATFYEAITKNPSYRPRFRFCHWSLSLAGAVGCVVVMFLISPLWAAVSVVLMVGLHKLIGRQEVQARWGDLNSGLLFERTRTNLLKLEEELYHPKNWRPIILALSGAGWSRPHLAVYGHWLTAGHGILSLGQVIQGETEGLVERRASQERLLHQFIREQELQAFPAVVVAPDVAGGIDSLVQCHGLGALRPNTVLLGWPDDPERAASFAATLRKVASLKRTVLALRLAETPDDPWQAPRGPIDVWWRGEENGEMMLLLAHLLTQNDAWRNHPIRLLRVIENAAGREEVAGHLARLIEAARIRAVPVVLVAEDVREAILQTSRRSALAFVGLQPPEEGKEAVFMKRMNYLAGDLPRIVYVDSGGGMSLQS